MFASAFGTLTMLVFSSVVGTMRVVVVVVFDAVGFRGPAWFALLFPNSLVKRLALWVSCLASSADGSP